MNRDHSVIFEPAPKYCIFDSFVDYEGYSISSKGGLPTVVEIMFIWIKFTHSIYFSSLIPKMSMFTLATACLTTSSLPWLMGLIFHIPMQYCSSQHETLLSPPDTSTTEHHFCFGPTASFFLKLLVIALYSSPVGYWTPSNCKGQCSSSGVISFCLFILFMGFLRQEYWSGVGCRFLLQ